MSALEDPRWLALSPGRRKHLLEEYRHVEVDNDDWHEPVYEEFKQKCTTLGIGVDKIYFSGFACQGDGACFTGDISNMKLFLTAAQQAKFIPYSEGWNVYIRTQGRYSHSGTMALTSCLPVEDNPHDVDESPLQHDAWNLRHDEICRDLDDLDGHLLTYLRSLADQLYRDLEALYDDLTNDETVASFLLDYEGITLEEPEDEPNSLAF